MTNRFISTPHSKYLFFLVFKTIKSFSFRSHLLNAVLIGLLFLQTGNDGGQVFDHVTLAFLVLLLLMFEALMLAILTCKTSNTVT